MNTTKELYNDLQSQKEQGRIFTKQDLTYDILYQLSIVENVSARSIGRLFGLTIPQVRYQRRKNNLENIYLKKFISRPEIMNGYLEEHNIDPELVTDEILYKAITFYASSKGWNLDLIDKYFMEQSKIQNQSSKESYDIENEKEIDYEVERTDSDIEPPKPKTNTKKSNGRRNNQIKNNATKIDAGKLGERIVIADEKKRLIREGLADLAKDVHSVTETDDKNITIDGKGYDVVSYNEKIEAIYIEVKCSTTNHKNNIIFDITDKEIEFINGKLDNIDKEHAFIYYVYNIDNKTGTAKIEPINYQKFQKLNMTPTSYRASGILTTKNK